MNVGSHGDYKWLVTELSFEDMLEFCPELVVGKYLAVTVMYGPKISAVEDLPYDKCCCFNEWYVFEGPASIGPPAEQGSNILQPPPGGERIHDFVRYCLDQVQQDFAARRKVQGDSTR